MSLLASIAMSLIFITDFNYTGVSNTVGVPTRGGAIWVDDKRKAGETQFSVFDIDPWGFFDKYPEDHIYVLLDAGFPGGHVPYTGRGIILSKHGTSLGVWFENFRNAELFEGVVIPAMPREPFQVIVHVNDSHVAFWIKQGGNQWFKSVGMLSNNTTLVSLLVVGATSDFSGPLRPPATFPVNNVRFGRFVTPK